MKIYIHESPTLQAIIHELVQELDPDCPVDVRPSVAVGARLTILVERALGALYDREDDENDSYIWRLRRDRVIMHVMQLPWTKIEVTSLDGTLLVYA